MMELLFEQLDNFLNCFKNPFTDEDLSNFVKLTDSILDYPSLIDDESESVKKARQIIVDLRMRNLIPILDTIPLKIGDKVDEVMADWLAERQTDNNPEDFHYSLRKLSFSTGTRNPLNYVKFYKKNSDELLSNQEIRQVVGNIIPKTFEEKYLIIFRKSFHSIQEQSTPISFI